MATSGPACSEISDNYVPNWLPYFDKSNGDLVAGVAIKVPCSICTAADLAILHPPNGDGDESTEAFAILPCGHAFGYECIKCWFDYAGIPTCPCCRKVMRHPVCRHTVSIERLSPTDGFNIHSAAPRPLGQSKQIADLCRRCEEMAPFLDAASHPWPFPHPGRMPLAFQTFYDEAHNFREEDRLGLPVLVPDHPWPRFRNGRPYQRNLTIGPEEDWDFSSRSPTPEDQRDEESVTRGELRAFVSSSPPRAQELRTQATAQPSSATGTPSRSPGNQDSETEPRRYPPVPSLVFRRHRRTSPWQATLPIFPLPPTPPFSPRSDPPQPQNDPRPTSPPASAGGIQEQDTPERAPLPQLVFRRFPNPHASRGREHSQTTSVQQGRGEDRRSYTPPPPPAPGRHDPPHTPSSAPSSPRPSEISLGSAPTQAREPLPSLVFRGRTEAASMHAARMQTAVHMQAAEAMSAWSAQERDDQTAAPEPPSPASRRTRRGMRISDLHSPPPPLPQPPQRGQPPAPPPPPGQPRGPLLPLPLPWRRDPNTRARFWSEADRLRFRMDPPSPRQQDQQPPPDEPRFPFPMYPSYGPYAPYGYETDEGVLEHSHGHGHSRGHDDVSFSSHTHTWGRGRSRW